MHLAHPEAWPAIAEVLPAFHGPLSSSSVSADAAAARPVGVEFLACAHLGVEGAVVSFGALQHVLCYTYDGRAQALGFIVDDDDDVDGGGLLVTCPPPSLLVAWTRRHKVVVIVRRT
jgi:hypothetical protein